MTPPSFELMTYPAVRVPVAARRFRGSPTQPRGQPVVWSKLNSSLNIRSIFCILLLEGRFPARVGCRCVLGQTSGNSRNMADKTDHTSRNRKIITYLVRSNTQGVRVFVPTPRVFRVVRSVRLAAPPTCGRPPSPE